MMVKPLGLTGAGVVLRDFTADDVEDAHAIVGDDRVTHWLSFDSKTRQETADMISGAVERAQEIPRAEYYLSITREDDDRTIGFVRLALGGVHAAKLGYALHADYWGHGYTTAATRIITEFGFARLDLHRISSAIGPDNYASLAIAESLGMTHEGRIRDHVYTNGAWRDSLLLGVLRHEWNTRPPVST